MLRLFWVGLLGMLLAGCASQAVVPRPAQLENAPFILNGRIAIKHQGERQSAGIRWIHQVQSDEIHLLTPLGTAAARIYQDAQHATLDHDDQHEQSDNLENLMTKVLGWHLPIKGLHHWVLGLPDPASSAQVERNSFGQLTTLQQDGWMVRYIRYHDSSPSTLPSRIQLDHDLLQVQFLMDEWDWSPQ
jgi:outer membrane lipoprotein LolB